MAEETTKGKPPAKRARIKAAKGAKAETFSADDYNSVAKSAQLLQITLVESRFKREEAYFEHAENEHDRSYGMKLENFRYDPENGYTGADFRWTTEVHAGNVHLVTIEATYRIFYHQLPATDEMAVAAFVSNVGKFATYPYFRSHVSHTAWEANLDMPILPVISSNR